MTELLDFLPAAMVLHMRERKKAVAAEEHRPAHHDHTEQKSISDWLSAMAFTAPYLMTKPRPRTAPHKGGAVPALIITVVVLLLIIVGYIVWKVTHRQNGGTNGDGTNGTNGTNGTDAKKGGVLGAIENAATSVKDVVFGGGHSNGGSSSGGSSSGGTDDSKQLPKPKSKWCTYGAPAPAPGVQFLPKNPKKVNPCSNWWNSGAPGHSFQRTVEGCQQCCTSFKKPAYYYYGAKHGEFCGCIDEIGHIYATTDGTPTSSGVSYIGTCPNPADIFTYQTDPDSLFIPSQVRLSPS